MNRKIKVMHYYTTPENSGGPMTYINTIVKSDLKDKYDFSVCFQLKTAKELRLRDARRIIAEIKKTSPDILHIHGLQSEGFFGVIFGKIAHVPRILMTVHGMDHEATLISEKRRKLFKYIIEPFSLRHSDYVYCVAKAAEKKDIIVLNSRKLLPCIQNATEYTQGNAVSRKQVGFSESDIIAIVVGRVSVDKGMHTLERVISANTNERIKFLIVGEGDYSLEMQQKYKGRKDIVFTGFTDNPCGYLDMADIYLCVSLHENMSIALLEAGQHGLPSVVTDVGDNADVVKDGVNGFVVRVDDSNSILKHIEELANDTALRKTMGEKAKENVNEYYSLEQMISKIDAVYQKIEADK